MKANHFIIGLAVLFGFIALVDVVFKCNNPQKKYVVDNRERDSLRRINIKFDSIQDHYATILLKQDDSIQRLNERLKTSKTIFITKYKQILKDSLITDSNCLITLYYANSTIVQQDSIIQLQDRSIDACSSQVINLREQVEVNKLLINDCFKKCDKLGQDLSKRDSKISKLKKQRNILGGLAAIVIGLFIVK